MVSTKVGLNDAFVGQVDALRPKVCDPIWATFQHVGANLAKPPMIWPKLGRNKRTFVQIVEFLGLSAELWRNSEVFDQT